MPRLGTTDDHAEFAVRLYTGLLVENQWQLDRAWLAIAVLLMTCDVWRHARWVPFHGAPVLTESNQYRLLRGGAPNKPLTEALKVRDRLAAELGIDRKDLCSAIGRFFAHPTIVGLQPNNPRGHAFRSLVAETISRFGDPELVVHEEVSPRELFPGFDFGNRSKDARIDIVVQRNARIVALVTTRWTYRHDRVDIIDEALAYVPSARRQNHGCRFFGVTAEFMAARLRKVIDQSSPKLQNAAIDRLVHLNPELPSDLVGRNGDLKDMWSLENMVEDSFNWQ
ncbi:MAG: hypothetical protein OXS30_07530 [Chloroflexota bacterium]|nr:hypothetical protein [Chloroflexota bacterium]